MVFWDDFSSDKFWHSFRELDQLQERLNRFFSGVRGSRSTAVDFPPVNLWTGEEGAILTAEIPGVVSDKVELSVVADTLTIRGEKPRVELREGETFHRQEREYGKFARSIQLPFAIEAEKVTAECKNGILHVTLPRADSEKPKKIPVKTS